MISLRIVLIIGLLSFGLASAAPALEGQKTIYLQNNNQEKLAIATIAFSKEKQQSTYQINYHEELFGDYFLSMRPFRCLESARLVCRQPYPYEMPRIIKGDDFRSLQHDLLFVTRELSGYGIDPYNGRYYVLSREGDRLVGQAFGVDLNDIASPPEEGVLYPIDEDLIDEMEAQSVQFPTLIIE